MARLDRRLRELVRAAGSAAALARAFGVSPSIVQRAAKHGVPKRSKLVKLIAQARVRDIRAYVRRQERLRKAELRERQRLRELDYQRFLREEKARLRAELARRRAAFKAIQRQVVTPEALASVLGLTERTARLWLRDGLPLTKEAGERIDKAVALLVNLESRERQAEDLARITEGMEAHQQAGLPEFPDVSSDQGSYEGAITEGYRWTRNYSRILTPDLIASIEAWFLSHRRQSDKWPFWQPVVEATVRGKPTGSPAAQIRQIDTSRPDLNDFFWRVIFPSRKSKNLRRAVRDVVERLITEYYKGNAVYVHGATLKNWRYRQEAERRRYQTALRRARQKEES